MKFGFLNRFSKITQNFMKNLLMGPELLNSHRRTEMTKLIVAFRNLANADKMDLNSC